MVEATEIVKRSRRFFRNHGLPDWAKQIPKNAAWEDGEERSLAYAEKCGFTEAWAFPPFAFQREHWPRLIDELVRKPSAELPDNQQYGPEPTLADTWNHVGNGKMLQRTDDLAGREMGPYVFFFSLEPIANAWGKTGKQIQEQFQAKGWQGLTVPEYLVLQRVLCERFRDHRFLPSPQDDKPTHWLWLLDSMTADACSVVMANPRGINIQACPAGNRDARRASLAGIVLRLKSAASIENETRNDPVE